jgi:hypothetical protein
LYGEPASGKSLVAIDWAARIATGTQWIDAKVKRDSVVVLAGEGHNGISRRLKAWQLKHGVSLDGAGLHVSSAGASLDTPQGLGDVVNALDDLPNVGLLIIDTMHRNFSGDENSASDVGAFIANIDALRNRYGCTVLIVHHSGHGSDKRARGSSSLKAAVDTSYRLDLNGVNRQLVCDKNKDAEPPKAKGFALEVIDLNGWHDDEGQTLTSVVLTPQDAPANRDKPLTDNQHLALETMLMIGESCVHFAEWKNAFYSKHSGDSENTKKFTLYVLVVGILKCWQQCNGHISNDKTTRVHRYKMGTSRVHVPTAKVVKLRVHGYTHPLGVYPMYPTTNTPNYPTLKPY